MTAHPSLLSLLEQWHQLTLVESQAIRARDWPRVRACQAAKEQLRPLLEQPRENLEACARTLLDRRLTELLDLEAANRAWLAAQSAVLQGRLQELEGSARNLKRVRGSYVQAESSRWHSYS